MLFGGRHRACRSTRDALSEYIDGRLSTPKRAAVEEHLAGCSACSEEVESLRALVEMLRQVPEAPVPRSFALREADVEPAAAPRPSSRGWLRPVPVMAAGNVAGWLSAFDPQRLAWLRPATAVVMASLVVLLMVDFLGVIPYGSGVDEAFLRSTPAETMFGPEAEAGGGVAEWDGEEQAQTIPVPAPAPSEKVTGSDIRLEDGSVPAGPAGDEGATLDSAAKEWPVRQIEIGLGVLVAFLVSVVVYGLWRRRRWGVL